MRLKQFLFATIFLTLAGCRSDRQTGAIIRFGKGVDLPGRQADGSILLPNQWSLRPAGAQIQLEDFPINIAVHPSGRFVVVLHSGYSANFISVVDLRKHKTVSQVNIEQAFYGLEFSADGRRVFCSGAGREVIHAFDFRNGTLTNHSIIHLRDEKERGFPAGIAVDRNARTLYVANVWADCVNHVKLGPQPSVQEIPMRENPDPPLKISAEKDRDPDTEAAAKRAEVVLLQSSPDATFPYACRLDEKRQLLYVSLWAQASIAVVDLQSNRVIAKWPSEAHPCEMVLSRAGDTLFVANANRNTVTVFDTTTGRRKETLWAALYPQSPPGSTPNSLALSPDEKTLFVANANLNLVAVFDVHEPGKSRSLGFIPVGWYPTSVRVTPDGKQLLVANGKGLESKANPLGPQPGISSHTNQTVEYIAHLFRGTLSVIDLPSPKNIESTMARYTADAYRSSPLKKDAGISRPHPLGNPVPSLPGESSPIKNIVYIIKENRTYDQVLGDMREGNGDPSLCLFPEQVTPNHHKIARDFVLLDNFYAEAEISADGHEWSMGAYATDFVEKMWPLTYGHNQPHKLPYPAEGGFPIASPAGGYLWDGARQAGVSYRSYGEFVDLFRSSDAPIGTSVKALKGHIDEHYPGFDLEYADTKRAARFISELKRFELEGSMPRLQIVRLPNDHTHGSTAGQRTPTAYLADNDLALGQIIEAISRSKFWPETVVFVVEDDAQNGPDHVDAHRTIAFVVSPYVNRHTVDSTMYSTSSLLRTMELILGLKPMSQFDAAATPMFYSFQEEPDLQPYTALPSNVDLDAKNPLQAWGSKLKLNFSREDAADDFLLNEAVWRSVRGGNSPLPPPLRAGFVFQPKRANDD